jgi:serine/threonine-protein kinase RsbW
VTRLSRAELVTDGYTLMVEAVFDAATVTKVRHQVQAAGRRCRMDAERLDDFIIAVNEVMTNAVRHGGGIGRLLLWRDGALLCQIVDRGPGFDPTAYLQPTRPQPSASGGMGIWLARQACDELRVHSGPTGTTISISGSLGSRAAP